MRRAVSVASASSAVALRGYVPANPFSRHAYTSRILLGSASAGSQNQQRARPVATVGTGKVPQAAKLASPANFFAVQVAATKGSKLGRRKTCALSRVFSGDGGGGGGWRKSSSLSAQVFGPTPDTSWVSVTKEIEVIDLKRLVGHGTEYFAQLNRIQVMSGARIRLDLSPKPVPAGGGADSTAESAAGGQQGQASTQPHRWQRGRSLKPLLVTVHFAGRQDQITVAQQLLDVELALEADREEIIALRRDGNPLKALHAFHRLRARAGREKLMILNEDYYIAMQACTELGNAEASLAVLRMLCESDIDVKPSFRAFRSFIRACATAGDAKPLLRALDDLERWGCSREESLDLLDKALNDLRVPAPACVIELVAAKARASLPLGEWVHDLITNGFTSARDLTELLASLETIREMRHAAEAGKNPLGTVPVGGDDVRRVRLHELARAVCLGAVNYENPAVAIAAFKEFRRCAKLEAPGPDAEAAAAELPSLAHSVLLVAGRMRRRQESGMLGRVLHSEAPGVPVGELFIAKAASGDVRYAWNSLAQVDRSKLSEKHAEAIVEGMATFITSKWVLRHIDERIKHEQPITPLMFASALLALGRIDIRNAFEAFDNLFEDAVGAMSRERPADVTIVFNALITSAASSQHWKAASLTWERMTKEGFPLNLHTHAALAIAAIRAGSPDLALPHIEELRQAGDRLQDDIDFPQARAALNLMHLASQGGRRDLGVEAGQSAVQPGESQVGV